MWIRRNSESEIEGTLRSLRAEASRELVESLAKRIHRQTMPRRRAWSRAAFAAAASAFILGSFASFGGLSYAATGAGGTVAAVKQLVTNQTLKVTVHKTSAASQYPNTPEKPKSKPFTPPKKVVSPAQTPAPVAPAQTLPFTGLSLLATLLVSVGLVGLGLLLRRRERRSS
jgi:hypothetical protein